MAIVIPQSDYRLGKVMLIAERTQARYAELSQSRVLVREAPSGLAVSGQVNRLKFFAHAFARAGTAACARTGRAGMVEGGATNGAASSDALRGRRSFATRPVQPV